MSWRKNLQKLSHAQVREIVGLFSGAVLLIGVAVFLSGGGKNLVTISGISPESQTASDFSCDIYGNCGGSFTPYEYITASPNPVAQGSSVTVDWQSNGNSSTLLGDTVGPKIWDSDGNVWLNRGYVGVTSSYRYGQFQDTITHTVTYYICGWYNFVYQNCTIPESQVTITVTAPPPPPPPPPTCSISSITSPTASGGTANITYTTTNSPTSGTITYTLPSGVTASPASGSFTPAASGSTPTGTLTNTNATSQTATVNVSVTNASGTRSCQGPTSVSAPSVTPTVTIAATDASAIINTSPAATGTFTVSGGSGTTALTVNYSVSGTGTRGTNYTVAAGTCTNLTTTTVVIPANLSFCTLILTGVDNSFTSGNKTAIYTPAAGTGYTAGSGGMIIIGLPRVIIVANAPTTITEGGSPNSTTYRFARTTTYTSALAVTFNTTGGTAAVTTDYTLSSGTCTSVSNTRATIPANAANCTVTITAAANSMPSGSSKTAILTPVTASGYTAGSASGPVTINGPASCPNGTGTAGSCTACNSGYTLSGGNCSPSCPNGTGTAGSCTSCNAGYVLSGGSCVVSAPIAIVTITGNGTNPTPNAIVGQPVTIVGTFTPGAGDTLTETAINDFENNLWCGTGCTPDTSMWTASPLGSKSYTFTPVSAGSYIFYPAVQTTAYPAWNNYSQSLTVTVGNACSNGSGVAGSCTSCNSGYVLSGGNCVLQCANGQGAAGSCTSCNAGYVLSGGSCYPTCPNGSGVAGSCTSCNAGYVLSGGSCYPTCPNGSGAAGSCTSCNAGYVLSGGSCVVSAPVSIVTFSANPTRVPKNTPTSVPFTWNITNPPASCTISGPSGFTPLTISPVDGVTGSQTGVVNIDQASFFTLTCGAATAQITLGLVPIFQEI